MTEESSSGTDCRCEYPNNRDSPIVDNRSQPDLPFDPCREIQAKFGDLGDCLVYSVINTRMASVKEDLYQRELGGAFYLIEVECHSPIRRRIPFLSSRQSVVRIAWSTEDPEHRIVHRVGHLIQDTEYTTVGRVPSWTSSL